MQTTDLILGGASILVGIGLLAAAAVNRLPNQTTPTMARSRRRFLVVAGVLLIAAGALVLAGIAPFAGPQGSLDPAGLID